MPVKFVLSDPTPKAWIPLTSNLYLGVQVRGLTFGIVVLSDIEGSGTSY